MIFLPIMIALNKIANQKKLIQLKAGLNNQSINFFNNLKIIDSS